MRKFWQTRKFWRALVAKQCRAFKRNYFNHYGVDAGRNIIYCPIEDRLLHWDEATVEHVIPFRQLLDQFLVEQGFNRFNVGNPKQFAFEWKKFHKHTAVLIVISSSLNQEIAKKSGKLNGTTWKRYQEVSKKRTQRGLEVNQFSIE